MFLNQLSRTVDFVPTKTVAAFQPNRFEPEFRLAVVAFDVGVRGIVAVTGVKEKPEWPNSQYSRHKSMVRQAASGSNPATPSGNASDLDSEIQESSAD